MRGIIMHGPGDVRVDVRETPTIEEPTDAVYPSGRRLRLRLRPLALPRCRCTGRAADGPRIRRRRRTDRAGCADRGSRRLRRRVLRHLRQHLRDLPEPATSPGASTGSSSTARSGPKPNMHASHTPMAHLWRPPNTRTRTSFRPCWPPRTCWAPGGSPLMPPRWVRAQQSRSSATVPSASWPSSPRSRWVPRRSSR